MVPLAIATPSLFPHCIAILVCWALPALYTLYGRDRGSAVFAVIEAVTCAIGNGLLTALPLYMASQDHSSDATDAAVQALIWLLFMAMYFPLEGTPPWASCPYLSSRAAYLWTAYLSSQLSSSLTARRPHERRPHRRRVGVRPSQPGNGRSTLPQRARTLDESSRPQQGLLLTRLSLALGRSSSARSAWARRSASRPLASPSGLTCTSTSATPTRAIQRTRTPSGSPLPFETGVLTPSPNPSPNRSPNPNPNPNPGPGPNQGTEA